ncbi:MAG: hypothetical protein ACOC4F_04565 [bacterium]
MSTFLTLLVLFLAVGTLSWELFERILSTAGIPVEWSVGPVGFDVEVLSVEFMVNPGSLVGIFAAFRVFKSA